MREAKFELAKANSVVSKIKDAHINESTLESQNLLFRNALLSLSITLFFNFPFLWS